MATHLDLEEQEQLDQLKHFWKRWGNLISWALIVVLGAYAAWNGWHYWQRQQASQSAVLYDTVERAALAADLPLLERSLADIQDKFGRTTFAHQAALMAARTFQDKAQTDKARTALSWVVDKASDPGLVALARLRLAALAIEAKSLDQARQALSGSFAPAFEPLVADRLGDIALLQDKRSEARDLYLKAWKGMDARGDYRALIEVKLAALGVNPAAQEKKQ